MALQYVSLERTNPLVLVTNTWTLITGYNVTHANDGGGADGAIANQSLGTIEVMETGVYSLHAYINLRNGNGQRSMSFIRDPLTAPDDTGNTNWTCTSGKDLQSLSWVAKPSLGTLFGLRVWHDNGSDLTLDRAQLKLSKVIPI